MRVVSLSLDPGVLSPESVVARRSVRYGEMVEAYTILVPHTDAAVTVLSERVRVYGIDGNKILQWMRMYKRLSALIESEGCDVISTQDSYFLGLLGLIVARRYQLGLEVQVLGVEKLSWFRKRLSQYVLRRASSIRVLSRVLWKRLVEEFGIPETNMHLVPIYVDTSKFGFVETNLTEGERAALLAAKAAFHETYQDRFNLLSVNRLVPVKNIPLQLEAVAMLKEEYPTLLLHIVGDGPLQGELQAEIARQGLDAHVVLEGSKFGPELSAFYTECDAFVLTSFSEGWGMAVIEAATAGLPIVMSNVGCAGEVIKHEESGLVVPVGEREALVAALSRVLSDSSLRERLSLGAQHAAASLLSFDEILTKYQASWEYANARRL